MLNVGLLMASLEYIEDHLCDNIRTEDVAAACFCSKSTLEKIFRCVFHISIRDYMIRRRMTGAAKRLAASDDSILDIAMEYGYSTHESFARAFRQVWNCNPSEFRGRRVTELFPRFQIPWSSTPVKNGGVYRRVDISELYDLFQERRDCYFVCCDIKHQASINKISHKAGDLSILETMNRMQEAAGEEDVVFRIGGNEFCILTDSSQDAYAARLAEKIRSRNGEAFFFGGRQIPLALHTTVIKLKPEYNSINYEELFTGLHNAIKEGKE